ncbi:MAG: citrate synthase family protein [Myxococcota bacterium]
MDDAPVDGEVSGEFLTARQAAELLGVKLPTVYAYTSRGLIQSVPSGRGRARRYRRRDLERLCARRDARAGHGPVAAAALRQGEPVLDSAITMISLERGPVYRGRAAVDLAREGRSFEWVAEGLWSGEWHEHPELSGWRQPITLGFDLEALERVLPRRVTPLSVMSVSISLLAARDPGRFSWHRDAVLPRVRELLRRVIAVLALSPRDAASGAAVAASLAAPSVAEAIGAAFSKRLSAEELLALNRALVLTADHELNASTFAARVVASTGADVYGCLSAALAALSGPRHGGAADRVEALLLEAGPAERVEQVVHDRQRRGEVIEGFAHPIYAPNADPRGGLLLEIARDLRGSSSEVQSVLALAHAMQQGGFGGPSIDVGLVAIARALALPVGSATALFAVGRTVGWVAHSLEQYEAGYLLRPRARYREEPEPSLRSGRPKL